jgi:xanthine dehydrogenase molybdopterin-binding subunit B
MIHMGFGSELHGLLTRGLNIVPVNFGIHFVATSTRAQELLQ